MIVPPCTMLLTTTDIRTSDSTGLYSYQVVGSTRSQQPEAYGKVFLLQQCAPWCFGAEHAACGIQRGSLAALHFPGTISVQTLN
jgi:hypothetical protein